MGGLCWTCGSRSELREPGCGGPEGAARPGESVTAITQASERVASRLGAEGMECCGLDQGTLDRLAAETLAPGTLAERMGIKIVSVAVKPVVRVEATMPVAGNIQPYGLLHGGASCVLAETIGSLGAVLHAGPGRIAVGIEINATHHRAARDGLVTAVATLAHGGRTLATFDIVITDEDGRKVCTSRLTCLVLSEGENQPPDLRRVSPLPRSSLRSPRKAPVVCSLNDHLGEHNVINR